MSASSNRFPVNEKRERMNVTGSAHATVSTVLKTVCHSVNHATRLKLGLEMMLKNASALAPR
jgi:hypothetical protein